jgi:hypothetical protein
MGSSREIGWMSALVAAVVLAASGCGSGARARPSDLTATRAGSSPTRTASAPAPAPAPGPAPAQAPESVLFFAGVSPAVAWAVTTGEQPREPLPQAVLRTVDGGRSWSTVTPPGLAFARGRTAIVGSYFLDATHAYLVRGPIQAYSSGTLLATGDGGRNWRTLGRLPAGGCEIQFVDPRHGWCLAVGAAMGQEQITVYRTSDGGRRWRRLSISPGFNGRSGSPGALPLACDKRIEFLTPSIGWAATYCAAGVSPLYETLDGGRTWVARTIAPPPGGLGAGELSGFPEVWPVGPVMAGSSGAAGMQLEGARQTESLVYRTSDGGRSWRPVVPPGRGRRWSIDLITSTDWVLAFHHRLLSTSDAGASWRTLHSDASISWPPMLFADGAGWFVNPDAMSRVLRTADGGRTWRLLRIPRVR